MRRKKKFRRILIAKSLIHESQHNAYSLLVIVVDRVDLRFSRECITRSIIYPSGGHCLMSCHLFPAFSSSVGGSGSYSVMDGISSVKQTADCIRPSPPKYHLPVGVFLSALSQKQYMYDQLKDKQKKQLQLVGYYTFHKVSCSAS